MICRVTEGHHFRMLEDRLHRRRDDLALRGFG